MKNCIRVRQKDSRRTGGFTIPSFVMQGDEDDDGMATRITWLLLLLLGSVAAASATVGTSEALDALPM